MATRLLPATTWSTAVACCVVFGHTCAVMALRHVERSSMGRRVATEIDAETAVPPRAAAAVPEPLPGPRHELGAALVPSALGHSLRALQRASSDAQHPVNSAALVNAPQKTAPFSSTRHP